MKKILKFMGILGAFSTVGYIIYNFSKKKIHNEEYLNDEDEEDDDDFLDEDFDLDFFEKEDDNDQKKRK